MAFGIKDQGISEQAAGSGLNLISRGTTIVGNITSTSNIRIDGEIQGNIICQDAVTISGSGTVKGDINAKTVIVGGKIYGDLNVQEKLVIESKGLINGEILTRRLVVEEGALFDGKCSMAEVPSETDK
jgi:cytoskeletal protein CcmA (bactofilin family)